MFEIDHQIWYSIYLTADVVHFFLLQKHHFVFKPFHNKISISAQEQQSFESYDIILFSQLLKCTNSYEQIHVCASNLWNMCLFAKMFCFFCWIKRMLKRDKYIQDFAGLYFVGKTKRNDMKYLSQKKQKINHYYKIIVSQY